MFYITLFCTVTVIMAFFYSLFMIIGKYILHDKIDNFNLKLSISLSFIILFSLLIYGLVTVQYNIENPTISKDSAPDYSGTLGDLIGGVLNPILALFGILAGGLAFYAQYQANKQIQDQFKIQQFESQFYEMLRLHKENVNEVEIEVREFEYKGPSGVQFDTGIYEPKKVKIKGRDIFIYFENELKIAFKFYVQFLIENEEDFNFEIPYKAFFNGINSDNNPFFIKLENDRTEIEKNYFLKYNETPILGVYLKSRYKLFEGHENILGHYYRHLFHTVKFITEQDNKFINYKEKRKYLRLLRAQLSNYEQAMLFYNYLAYAKEWEDGNKFFTDYRMIHNLYENVLFDHECFKTEYNNLKLKQRKALCYKDNDHIFESQRWESDKNIKCKNK